MNTKSRILAAMLGLSALAMAPGFGSTAQAADGAIAAAFAGGSQTDMLVGSALSVRVATNRGGRIGFRTPEFGGKQRVRLGRIR